MKRLGRRNCFAKYFIPGVLISPLYSDVIATNHSYKTFPCINKKICLGMKPISTCESSEATGENGNIAILSEDPSIVPPEALSSRFGTEYISEPNSSTKTGSLLKSNPLDTGRKSHPVNTHDLSINSGTDENRSETLEDRWSIDFEKSQTQHSIESCICAGTCVHMFQNVEGLLNDLISDEVSFKAFPHSDTSRGVELPNTSPLLDVDANIAMDLNIETDCDSDLDFSMDLGLKFTDDILGNMPRDFLSSLDLDQITPPDSDQNKADLNSLDSTQLGKRQQPVLSNQSVSTFHSSTGVDDSLEHYPSDVKESLGDFGLYSTFAYPLLSDDATHELFTAFKSDLQDSFERDEAFKIGEPRNQQADSISGTQDKLGSETRSTVDASHGLNHPVLRGMLKIAPKYENLPPGLLCNEGSIQHTVKEKPSEVVPESITVIKICLSIASLKEIVHHQTQLTTVPGYQIQISSTLLTCLSAIHREIKSEAPTGFQVILPNDCGRVTWVYSPNSSDSEEQLQNLSLDSDVEQLPPRNLIEVFHKICGDRIIPESLQLFIDESHHDYGSSSPLKVRLQLQENMDSENNDLIIASKFLINYVTLLFNFLPSGGLNVKHDSEPRVYISKGPNDSTVNILYDGNTSTFPKSMDPFIKPPAIQTETVFSSLTEVKPDVLHPKQTEGPETTEPEPLLNSDSANKNSMDPFIKPPAIQTETVFSSLTEVKPDILHPKQTEGPETTEPEPLLKSDSVNKVSTAQNMKRTVEVPIPDPPAPGKPKPCNSQTDLKSKCCGSRVNYHTRLAEKRQSFEISFSHQMKIPPLLVYLDRNPTTHAWIGICGKMFDHFLEQTNIKLFLAPENIFLDCAENVPPTPPAEYLGRIGVEKWGIADQESIFVRLVVADQKHLSLEPTMQCSERISGNNGHAGPKNSEDKMIETTPSAPQQFLWNLKSELLGLEERFQKYLDEIAEPKSLTSPTYSLRIKGIHREFVVYWSLYGSGIGVKRTERTGDHLRDTATSYKANFVRRPFSNADTSLNYISDCAVISRETGNPKASYLVYNHWSRKGDIKCHDNPYIKSLHIYGIDPNVPEDGEFEKAWSLIKSCIFTSCGHRRRTLATKRKCSLVSIDNLPIPSSSFIYEPKSENSFIFAYRGSYTDLDNALHTEQLRGHRKTGVPISALRLQDKGTYINATVYSSIPLGFQNPGLDPEGFMTRMDRPSSITKRTKENITTQRRKSLKSK